VGWEEVAWVDRHFDDEPRLKAEVSWNRVTQLILFWGGGWLGWMSCLLLVPVPETGDSFFFLVWTFAIPGFQFSTGLQFRGTGAVVAGFYNDDRCVGGVLQMVS
jgi:hypothetical protein